VNTLEEKNCKLKLGIGKQRSKRGLEAHEIFGGQYSLYCGLFLWPESINFFPYAMSDHNSMLL
jgi:hypothetical protein